MDNGVILALARENAAMSDVDRLVNLYHLLTQILVFGVSGSVVEVGCHAGGTSVFLRMILDHFDSKRPFHVYDSFRGLPPPGESDAYLREGDCEGSLEQFRVTFSRWSAALPTIHEGWFADTLPGCLPDTIAFAYIDADFYDSTMTALVHVYPRMAPKGILCLDDYADPERNPRAWGGLPGVKRACDDFFADKADRVSVLVGNGDLAFGIIRKGGA